MSRHQARSKWHQQKRWILGSLLLFPPLGISLLWLTHWPRAGKIGGSLLSGFLLLSVLTGESSETPAVSVEPPAQASVAVPAKPAAISTAAYEDALFEATAATAELAAAESPADWAQIASRWQAALSSLNDIPLSSDDYDQAQVKIAEYERNYEYAIAQKTAVELAVAEAITQAQAAEEVIAQQRLEAEAIAQAAPLPVIEEPQGGYVDGTCKELKASGVGSNFMPGEANYTSARDRDGDGVACES